MSGNDMRHQTPDEKAKIICPPPDGGGHNSRSLVNGTCIILKHLLIFSEEAVTNFRTGLPKAESL